MNIDNLVFIYLIIIIDIPAAIIVFLVKIANSQKKMKAEKELLNKRISELESK